jgi:hypothetical protein
MTGFRFNFRNLEHVSLFIVGPFYRKFTTMWFMQKTPFLLTVLLKICLALEIKLASLLSIWKWYACCPP